MAFLAVGNDKGTAFGREAVFRTCPKGFALGGLLSDEDFADMFLAESVASDDWSLLLSSTFVAATVERTSRFPLPAKDNAVLLRGLRLPEVRLLTTDFGRRLGPDLWDFGRDRRSDGRPGKLSELGAFTHLLSKTSLVVAVLPVDNSESTSTEKLVTGSSPSSGLDPATRPLCDYQRDQYYAGEEAM